MTQSCLSYTLLHTVHAAVIAINEAIDHQMAPETLIALQIAEAHLVNIEVEFAEKYQDVLYAAKYAKAEATGNKVQTSGAVNS